MGKSGTLILLMLISISFIGFVSAACPIGLTAYYNNGDGLDSSGNGNHMFLFGKVTQSSEGKMGNALSFDGTKYSFTEIPTRIFDNEKLTFATWIKTSRAKGGILYLSKDSRYVWEFNPLAGLGSMNIQQRAVTSNLGTTADGKWHYVVITFDSVEGKSRVYLDGKSVSNITTTKTKLNHNYAALGQYQGTEPANFNGRYSFLGLMDEVAFFNRVLSDSEVASYYNSGFGKDLCSATSSPTLPSGTQPINTTPVTTVPTCPEIWTCGSWSACNNGQQTRTCADTYNCGTTVDKPNLIQTCTVLNISTGENDTATCADSDGGPNYYQQGYIDQTFSQSGRHSDSCINASAVKEWSCVPNGTFRYDDYICPNGCNNGACLPENNQTSTCTDSDNGLNYYTRGSLFTSFSEGTNFEDYCLDSNTLIERHCLSSNPNNFTVSYTCPNGCSNGACSTAILGNCNNLLNKIKNPVASYKYSGIEFRSSWNDVYTTTEWINNQNENVVAYQSSWYGYEDGKSFDLSYNILVFENEDVDLNEWLEQRTSHEVCQITSHGNVNTDNYYYICNWDILENRQNINDRNHESRQVYWVNKNIAVQINVYSGRWLSNEEITQLSQKRLNRLLDDLVSNERDYVSWENFDFDWQLRGQIVDDFEDCPSEVVLKVNPENNNTCWPSWSCKIEPVICPEYGFQKKTCVDYSCGQQVAESQIYCSPGICSGCMVPRWFSESGFGDSKCIPYGFRFAQQTGWEKKFVERTESDVLNENSNNDYLLTVISSNEAKLTIFFKNENQTYVLKKGETISLDPSNFGGDIKSMSLYTRDIKFVSGGSLDNYVSIDAHMVGFDNSAKTFNAYCDIDGQVKEQRTKQSTGDWTTCQNNYECYSNLCSGGSCIEINDMIAEVRGFKATGVKILCRLASIFGVKDYDSCLVGYLGDDYISLQPHGSSSDSSGGSSNKKSSSN